VSSLVGVTAFLVLLFFAVQLCLNLYAGSAVAAVAFDGASAVAAAPDPVAAMAAAEARARRILDRFEAGGGRLTFGWDASVSDVALTIEAERPQLLPRVRLPFEHLRRTSVVRREVVR
jgi:hypothetical protein